MGKPAARQGAGPDRRRSEDRNGTPCQRGAEQLRTGAGPDRACRASELPLSGTGNA
nr:hypothetical protein RVX_0302 [Nitratidesulfovibrio sp. HK-II]